MDDNDATDSISRRSVLKTAGGLVAGATMVAGRGAALPDRHGPIRIEVEEVTEEVVAVGVRTSEDVADPSEFPGLVYLGHVDQFGIDGETVRLPDDPDGLASPVESKAMGPDRGNFVLYFRVRDLDFSAVSDLEGADYVTVGLGVAAPDGPELLAFDTDEIRLPALDGVE